MAFQIIDLPLQTVRKANVVSVHAGKVLGPAELYRLIESSGKAGVQAVADDSNAGIAEPANRLESSIAGAVIEYE